MCGIMCAIMCAMSARHVVSCSSTIAHQPFDINHVEWCTWCGEHEPCVVMHTNRQGPPRLRVPRSRRYVEGLGFRCRVQVHGLGRVPLVLPCPDPYCV
jgi:hypothetical protein